MNAAQALADALIAYGLTEVFEIRGEPAVGIQKATAEGIVAILERHGFALVEKEKSPCQ